MSGQDRERRLAREHYERQQARRAEAASEARKRSAVVAAVVAVLFVVAGGVAVAVLGGEDEDVAATTPTASPEPTPPEAAPCPTVTPNAHEPMAFGSEPELTIDRTATYHATLRTNCGPIVVDLLARKAPRTVNSFAFLARQGYFDSTPCHRLTTEGIYVLQCGDPSGTGNGGPGYTIPLENAPADQTYPAGTLAMARAQDPDSGGSQFFLVYRDSVLPAPGYTIFGRVTQGLDVVRTIAKAGVTGGATDGVPAYPVVIESVEVTEKGSS